MMSDQKPLITAETKIKVSSTLDKSVGKKNLVDGDPATCWTSQQGIPQFVQLTFPTSVVPRQVALTFQGGFVGTRCSIQVLPSEAVDGKGEWHTISHIYPEDVNRKQTFDILSEQLDSLRDGIRYMKIIFEESSDFFGRITVYDLQIEGHAVETSGQPRRPQLH
ncbi:galactose-binding like protein [Obba rivulosa]|uniref:Galactose-binding like protein n=1 Tax=Obba rivulosa TaxID=1052685 RepID=A0A8E2AXM4_9APHY|nr:galactose-binding like protein [Obba rivulosa]